MVYGFTSLDPGPVEDPALRGGSSARRLTAKLRRRYDIGILFGTYHHTWIGGRLSF